MTILARSVQRRKWSPDRKWSPNWTENDPEPEMIAPENEEWYGVCSSGPGFNFLP